MNINDFPKNDSIQPSTSSLTKTQTTNNKPITEKVKDKVNGTPSYRSIDELRKYYLETNFYAF